MTVAAWFHRLLIGDTPWIFLLEVIYRALFVYLFLLAIMRAMGKRMAAQMSISELAVILMLGAAISAPIQMPTQGILPAFVVLATVGLLQRGVSWWSYRSRAVELKVHGDVACLVKDGRLMLDQLAKTKISRDLLISELRASGIRELGELRRVYMESSGKLSLIRYRQARPGLSLAPESDAPAWPVVLVDHTEGCGQCGATVQVDVACFACGSNQTKPICLPWKAL